MNRPNARLRPHRCTAVQPRRGTRLAALVRSGLRAAIAPLFILALASGAWQLPARAAEPKPPAASPTPRPIDSWLLLGPTSDPLPAFGTEKPGQFALDEALALVRIDPAESWPREGDAVVVHDPTAPLRWARRDAEDGVVTLAAPADGPSIAWLAVTLESPRFIAADLELLGSHPRRIWCDGAPLASGSGARVEGKLALWPGSHRLLVQTVLDPQRTEPWTIGVRLTKADDPLTDVASSLLPGRRLDLLDTLNPPIIDELVISPDGARFAQVMSRIVPGRDDGESWFELRRSAGGALERTVRGAPVAANPQFDPAGRWLSYTTTTAEKTTLWIDDGRQTRALVTDVERFGGYRWIPGGWGLIYGSSEVPPPDPRQIKRVEGVLDRRGDQRTRRSLSLVTLDGARRRLTAGATSATLADIAPDGSRLLFLREFDDYSQRPFTHSELWELDLRRFSATRRGILRFAFSVAYAPDGRLAVVSSPAEFALTGFDLPRGAVANNYEGEFYLWDPEQGQAECVTRDFVPSVEELRWNEATGNWVVQALDRDRRRLYLYAPATRTFQPLDTGGDVVETFSVARTAPAAVVSASGPWNPGALGALDLKTQQRRSFEHPTAAALQRLETGSERSWSFRSASGETIDGRLYLPPGFDPQKRYPLIVNYYGGVFPITRVFGGRYPKEWWASLGYVVYVLQPSGSVGYGNRFAALHSGEWGKRVIDEITEGTKRFLAAHPFVDPERVGAIGASYGGFATMLLLTRSQQFAAAVSHAGISSIGGYWGEGVFALNYNATSAPDSFPWNDRALYVERSPLFHADKIKTPLLLTHGASDTNVPVGESDGLFTALKLLGAPVEYLQVEGEDHWILAHPKRVVWARSIAAWFERWLKQDPKWWDDLYPPRDK